MRVEALLGHVTLQGLPRPGRRKFGVPPGGAFDPGVVVELNRLLGNPEDALCLELALASATLASDEPLAIAYAGAPCTVRAGGGKLPPRQVALLVPGTKLDIPPPSSGVRIWIAVAGGFEGLRGERVKQGNLLQVGPAGVVEVGHTGTPTAQTVGPLPVVSGDPRFAGALNRAYTVSHASDRIGIRLDGYAEPNRLELPSRPATFGTIQVTPSGQLVILGPDGPTIGGYPQAGTVRNDSLGRLAQLRPGDEVRFEVEPAPARPGREEEPTWPCSRSMPPPS